MLLMPWLCKEPGHQQPWYWVYRICRFFSYLRKCFKYPCQINLEERHKMQIYVYVRSEKICTQRVNMIILSTSCSIQSCHPIKCYTVWLHSYIMWFTGMLFSAILSLPCAWYCMQWCVYCDDIIPRGHYIVISSLIGWAHTQNDLSMPWSSEILYHIWRLFCCTLANEYV